MRFLSIAFALAAGLAAAVPTMAHDHSHMHAMEAAEPLPGMSIYNLSGQWTDQNGRTVELSSLRGAPVVVAMAYTSCRDICPLIVADITLIERAAQDGGVGRMRFAFFSLDPVNDTPARLKTYAEEHGLDPEHWTLFHGDERAVRELAAALGVRYRRTPDGGYDHSNLITLLDRDGAVLLQQSGADTAGEAMIKALVAASTK
jgi:protein SCO1/2